MPTAVPCGICLNPVAKNHKAVKCDNCDLWIHIKYNNINVKAYNLLINDNTVWYCLTCSKKLYPFLVPNDNDFHSTIQGKTIKFKAFTRKRSSIENVITDKLNDAVSESDLENSSQYFEVDDFNKAFNSSNHKGTNFFHVNISSLSYNFDHLHTLLSKINKGLLWRVITFCKKQTKLHQSQRFQYIQEKWARVYFYSGKNIIAGCIYRHPCMHPSEFSYIYILKGSPRKSFT